MCRNSLMCFFIIEVMEKTYTVKARTHFGTKGLDITIPTYIVKKHNIKQGDIFKVVTDQENDNLIIKFERVYSNE